MLIYWRGTTGIMFCHQTDGPLGAHTGNVGCVITQ